MIVVIIISYLLDGVTPLMLASVRGGGVEIEISEEDTTSDENTTGVNDGSESIIASLLLQGASLTAQTDKSGESRMLLETTRM